MSVQGTTETAQSEEPQSSEGDHRRDPAERLISRRMILGESIRSSWRQATAGFAALAAASAAAHRAEARPDPDASADADPSGLLLKLVNRLTFGYSDAEMALANSLGYDGYLEHHLNYAAIDDSQVDARLTPAQYPILTMPPDELFAQPQNVIISQLTEATIIRAWLTKRQLFERMVEFWTDHFSMDILQGIVSALRPVDDRAVTRPFALATFGELLNASMHSPCMLFYLDNHLNTAAAPNENYARELLELHTMGVDGGYTQNDVVEVTRCLTGWTFYQRNFGTLNGYFRYVPANHDNGQKVVLGNIIPAGGGINDGHMVRDILLNHPSTARFIATKMCRRFIGEDVRQSVIDSVAATYASSNGDIKAMLRTIFRPGVLYDATPRFKRPFHLAVSALRAMPTNITGSNGLRNHLTSCGHHPFYWSPPDGYPDTLEYWSGLILPRWNIGASMLSNDGGTGTGIPGVTVDINAFLSGLSTGPAIANKIDQALFGGKMPASEKARVQAYLGPGNPSVPVRRDAIGLAIDSPGFQWY